MFDNMLRALREKNFFCKPEHVDRIFHIIEHEINDELTSNALFVKTLIATMCPYETPNIVKAEEIDKDQICAMYENMDYTKI